MLEVVFTCDYEIHGNGEGSPRRLMVEPTARMLACLERHGAKLTVMADVCEILRFRRHQEETGVDDFAYGEIADQLRATIARGHDVQLHLHPAYLNARPDEGRWLLDHSEYDLARLDRERIHEIVGEGKAYLEALLREVDDAYRCLVSRSANWSMQPTAALARALIAHGLVADTSVFKHGRRDGAVSFDYANAPSALVPWRIDPGEVCRVDPRGELLELPIYCELLPLAGFASANRAYNAFQVRRHAVPARSGDHRPSPASQRRTSILGALARFARRHPRKLDFNQCTGRQLIAGTEGASRRYDRPGRDLPLILIGHSKLFGRRNERQLERFLSHVAEHPQRYRFATIREALERLQAPGIEVGAHGPVSSRSDATTAQPRPAGAARGG